MLDLPCSSQNLSNGLDLWNLMMSMGKFLPFLLRIGRSKRISSFLF